MPRAQLALPPVYQRQDAFNPDFTVTDFLGLQEQAESWARQNQLKGVGADRHEVVLMIIDDQDTFSFPPPNGQLTVDGAMEDQDRLVQFGFRNMGLISEMIPTLDSHSGIPIFFPFFHVDAEGNHPAPFTPVFEDDYRTGRLRVNPVVAGALWWMDENKQWHRGVDYKWLNDYVTYYCGECQRTRTNLTIWPYHGMLGSNGHRLTGVVDQLRLFHSFARGPMNRAEVKGVNPFAENYSVFRPEVMTFHDGSPIPFAQKNVELIARLLRSDMVILAGQAKSHCLTWSVSDLVDEFSAYPEMVNKIYLLEDCTSAVTGFEKAANDAFNEFRSKGLHIVRSTDPIETWPGIAGRIAA